MDPNHHAELYAAMIDAYEDATRPSTGCGTTPPSTASTRT